MQKSKVLILFCIAAILVAGCAGNSNRIADPVGSHGDITKTRVIAFTATNEGNVSEPHTVVVTFQGGQDARDLTSYQIGLDGKILQEVTDTKVGLQTRFTNLTAGIHGVAVTAKFNDGTEKVFLATEL
jgi:hypothetical protein